MAPAGRDFSSCLTSATSCTAAAASASSAGPGSQPLLDAQFVHITEAFPWTRGNASKQKNQRLLYASRRTIAWFKNRI